MVHDETEDIRRQLVNEINDKPRERLELEKEYGQVWDTQELTRDFDVTGFMAPFVVVRRRSDGVVGSLMFQGSPRYYYGFKPD
ncbi:MAG: hypothetical protein QW828_03820 [Candidatus Bathyarchaeia archaeon]